jgi:hypothetical protein
VPRADLHTFRNDGEDDVRFITGYDMPGFERFFEEFGFDASRPGAYESSISAETVRRVAEGCSRHGMILVPDGAPDAR